MYWCPKCHIFSNHFMMRIFLRKKPFWNGMTKLIRYSCHVTCIFACIFKLILCLKIVLCYCSAGIQEACWQREGSWNTRESCSYYWMVEDSWRRIQWRRRYNTTTCTWYLAIMLFSYENDNMMKFNCSITRNVLFDPTSLLPVPAIVYFKLMHAC